MKFDLVCGSCKHLFETEADSSIKDDEKNCPECGSDRVRQTFKSYLRNGPLLDPKWSCGGEYRGFG